MVIDWVHVGELVFSNIFVAGMVYGTIRADLKALHARVERCETDIRNTDARIDELLLKGK